MYIFVPVSPFDFVFVSVFIIWSTFVRIQLLFADNCWRRRRGGETRFVICLFRTPCQFVFLTTCVFGTPFSLYLCVNLHLFVLFDNLCIWDALSVCICVLIYICLSVWQLEQFEQLLNTWRVTLCNLPLCDVCRISFGRQKLGQYGKRTLEKSWACTETNTF